MSLQPLFSLWPVLLTLFLLALVLAGLEWRRGPKWRGWRLVAVMLLIAAVAGLLLRPAREVTVASDALILLTKNYERAVADSLHTAHPQWPVWRTADSEPFPKSNVLADLLDLTVIAPRISAIVGEGLPPDVLEYFPERRYQFFPSPAPTGITSLVQKTYREGQPNRVEGQYCHRGAPVRLLLHGPAAAEDSLLIREPGCNDFSLTFVPKESGQWLYRIQRKDSLGQVLEEQLLPVKVAPAEQLRVLILQAFPTFELRYLKDFLADRGHAVAVRAQLSRDKFRTEFANLSRRQLGRLTTELLSDFDLILANGATYEQLNYAERSAIDRAVDDGLGFLGVIDGDHPAFRRRLGLYRIAAEPDTVRLEGDITAVAFDGTPNSSLEWYTTLSATGDRALAAYHYQGRGKIGFQAIRESYTTLLRGDSLTYAALWTPILEGVQRAALSTYFIDLEQDFPIYAGRPLDFRVTATAPLPAVFADSSEVPMLEDYHIDEVWYGRTWPRDTGWHRIRVGEELLDYYAFPAAAWSSLATMQKLRQTAFGAGSGIDPEETELRSVVRQPIPAFWFYLIFLLGAGGLWLAPKLGA